jgi:heme/copper-type cytochrome/quinol oxidase subunit 3
LTLVALSLLLVAAERAFRRGSSRNASRALIAALGLGIGFLALQTWNWMQMAAGNVLPQQNILIWGFYTLTFLHAVHVLGGLVPLVLTTVRAYGGRYADDHEAVHLVGLYWHFLLATWVAIFVVLMI